MVIALGALLGAAPAAGAQGRAPVAVELQGGWEGFLDDARIDTGFVGGGARIAVSRRVSVGPEVVYVIGPNTARDLYVTGNVVVDLRADRAASRVMPYLIGGGGFSRHTQVFARETFSSYEGALTGGGGLRVWIARAVYLAPEVRIGWEPHVRVGMTIGVDLGS